MESAKASGPRDPARAMSEENVELAVRANDAFKRRGASPPLPGGPKQVGGSVVVGSPPDSPAHRPEDPEDHSDDGDDRANRVEDPDIRNRPDDDEDDSGRIITTTPFVGIESRDTQDLVR